MPSRIDGHGFQHFPGTSESMERNADQAPEGLRRFLSAARLEAGDFIMDLARALQRDVGVGRRALVTGANGLIGSHVVRELLCEGYRVRAFVRREDDR